MRRVERATLRNINSNRCSREQIESSTPSETRESCLCHVLKGTRQGNNNKKRAASTSFGPYAIFKMFLTSSSSSSRSNFFMLSYRRVGQTCFTTRERGNLCFMRCAVCCFVFLSFPPFPFKKKAKWEGKTKMREGKEDWLEGLGTRHFDSTSQSQGAFQAPLLTQIQNVRPDIGTSQDFIIYSSGFIKRCLREKATTTTR